MHAVRIDRRRRRAAGMRTPLSNHERFSATSICLTNYMPVQRLQAQVPMSALGPRVAG